MDLRWMCFGFDVRRGGHSAEERWMCFGLTLVSRSCNLDAQWMQNGVLIGKTTGTIWTCDECLGHRFPLHQPTHIQFRSISPPSHIHLTSISHVLQLQRGRQFPSAHSISDPLTTPTLIHDTNQRERGGNQTYHITYCRAPTSH